ncbi:fibronectin type III domain-containing protein [Patescibacteria group bacterium]
MKRKIYLVFVFIFTLTAIGVSAAKPFPAPTDISAITVSSSQINLNWADNSRDEAGFSIEQSTNGIDFSEINTVGANTTTHNSTNLNASTSYWYKVRAYRIKKGVYTYSDYSNIDNDTTYGAAPDAPTSLDTEVYYASSTPLVYMTWTDNAEDENGFEIERSINGVDFNYLDWVEENQTSYSDRSISASTTYWYKVRAHNDYGYSDYSNIDSAFVL